MNARASRLVNKLSVSAGKLRDLRVELMGLKDEYQFNGGASFIHEHWLDENGDPRIDLDIPESDILTLVASLAAIIVVLEDHKTPLIKAAL